MNKSQYKSLSEWRKANPKDYQTAWRKGYLDEICQEMGWDKPNSKPNGYWNIKENVLAEAKKYDSIIKWRINSASSYQAARKHGWYELATAHMELKRKVRGFWSIKENVLAEAKKYDLISKWVRSSASSYQAAKTNCWYEEATAHMELKRKVRGFWSIKENVLAEARKYNTKNEWIKKSYGSYQSAKRNGWIEECVAHMKLTRKPTGYWDNKDRVLAESKKYKTKNEWRKKSGSSYDAAKRNGWMDEATAHMKKRK